MKIESLPLEIEVRWLPEPGVWDVYAKTGGTTRIISDRELAMCFAMLAPFVRSELFFHKPAQDGPVRATDGQVCFRAVDALRTYECG